MLPFEAIENVEGKGGRGYYSPLLDQTIGGGGGIRLRDPSPWMTDRDPGKVVQRLEWVDADGL